LSIFWSAEKIQISLKSNKNNRYFTRTLMYVFDRISLSSCENKKCFRKKKLYRKSNHIF